MNRAFGNLQTLLVIQKIAAGACRALLLIKLQVQPMHQFALKLSNLRRKLEYVGPVLPSHFGVIVDLLVRGFALCLGRVGLLHGWASARD